MRPGRLRTALFVDFDNIFSTLNGIDHGVADTFVRTPADWLGRLASFGLEDEQRWYSVRRCYMNPSGSVPGTDGARLYFSSFRPFFVASGFEVVDCPPLARSMKNAADIRIALDVMDLVHAGQAAVDEVVLMSGDSDFTPLLLRLRSRGVRTLVISGGQASPAYVSVADGYIDESGVVDLVTHREEPRPQETAAAVSAALVVEIADDRRRSERLAAFRSFAAQELADSPGQVLLATLGVRARSEFGTVIESTNWFGAGSLAGALGPGFAVSGHWLYDPARVEAPAPPLATQAEPRGSVAPIVASVERVVALPRLAAETWPALFESMAEYARTHEFNLTEVTAWVRDQLGAMGKPVGRQVVGWAVRGAMYGGAPLTARPAPSGQQLAGAVLRNTAKLARDAQLELARTEYLELAAHLGVDVPPNEDNGDTD